MARPSTGALSLSIHKRHFWTSRCSSLPDIEDSAKPPPHSQHHCIQTHGMTLTWIIDAASPAFDWHNWWRELKTVWSPNRLSCGSSPKAKSRRSDSGEFQADTEQKHATEFWLTDSPLISNLCTLFLYQRRPPNTFGEAYRFARASQAKNLLIHGTLSP